MIQNGYQPGIEIPHKRKKRCTALDLFPDFIDKGGFKDALTIANRKA